MTQQDNLYIFGAENASSAGPILPSEETLEQINNTNLFNNNETSAGISLRSQPPVQVVPVSNSIVPLLLMAGILSVLVFCMNKRRKMQIRKGE